MAIQHRRGAYSNFDKSRLVPGEIAVVLSGDSTHASDGATAYINFNSSTTKQIAFMDDIDSQLEAAVDGVVDEATEQAAGYAASAEASAIEIASSLEQISTNTTDIQDSRAEINVLFESEQLDYPVSSSYPTGWRSGYYDRNDGSAKTSDKFIRSADYISLDGIDRITLKPPSGFACSIVLYDEEKHLIRGIGTANSNSTPSQINVIRDVATNDCAFARLSVGYFTDGDGDTRASNQSFIDTIIFTGYKPIYTTEIYGLTDNIDSINEDVSGINDSLDIMSTLMEKNDDTFKTKTVPINISRNISDLKVQYIGGKIYLNGTNSSSAVVLESDSLMGNDYIYYRQANNSGLLADIAAHPLTITSGEYKFVFRMLSGTVTRSGTTYISNEQFGSVNVVNAYLWESNPESSTDYLAKTSVSKNLSLDAGQIGLQTLYIYQDCTFDNAIFELYLEKEVVDELPAYWTDEINTSISTIQNNIVSASTENSATVCFVTDCHWRANQKHSPEIVKRLFAKCNINYFVNGGDLIETYRSSKELALGELTDCINAFRNCGKPMITLYGNHDRNRVPSNPDSSTYLEQHEHANAVFKSFMPKITRLTNDFSTFYWEDDIYRYVCVYWWNSSSRTLPGAVEMFNTTKPVVVFTHGIYFKLGYDTTDDRIDSAWILQAFEPYKNQIRCFIQGHAHVDGIRHAWSTVPIVIIDCDKTNMYSTPGTITEQSVAVITIDADTIKVVKVGKGEDFTITSSSTDWRQTYDSDPAEEDEPSDGEL